LPAGIAPGLAARNDGNSPTQARFADPACGDIAPDL
jgi:hypothetical protein